MVMSWINSWWEICHLCFVKSSVVLSFKSENSNLKLFFQVLINRILWDQKKYGIKWLSVMGGTCNQATLKAEFGNSVGSTLLGVNSPSNGGWIVWPTVIQHNHRTLHEKYPKTRVIFGVYFPLFGPETTPYLDTFHAVGAWLNTRTHNHWQNIWDLLTYTEGKV